MTVRDLIAVLGQMPQDATVILNMGKNELANSRSVGKAELLLAHQVNRSSPDGEWYNTGEWNYDPEQHTPPVAVVNLTPG